MIQRKDDTVRISGLQPEMLFALLIAEEVFAQFGATPTERLVIVTSGTDDAPGRLPGSLHKVGRAMDLGIKHVARDRWGALRIALVHALGDDEYDVVLEADKPDRGPHLHVEFQPKRKAAASTA